MRNEEGEQDEMTGSPAEWFEAPKEPSSHRMTVSHMHAIELVAANDTASMEPQDMETVVSTIPGSEQSDTTIEKPHHKEELGRKLEMEATKKHQAVAEGEIQANEAEQEIEQRRKAVDAEECLLRTYSRSLHVAIPETPCTCFRRPSQGLLALYPNTR